MEDECKIELIRKSLISELIIDGLFNSLKKTSNGKIEVENYKIDEKNMTYLLKKYDAEKFEAYEKMLLTNDEEEDDD